MAEEPRKRAPHTTPDTTPDTTREEPVNAIRAELYRRLMSAVRTSISQREHYVAALGGRLEVRAVFGEDEIVVRPSLNDGGPGPRS